MSTHKTLRLIIVLIILALSIGALLWSCWPMERQTQSVPVNPVNLQLPTPEGFIPLFAQVI